MVLAPGFGITTGTVIYLLSNLRSNKEDDLSTILNTCIEGSTGHGVVCPL
ncbi:MAG TPA: hypothetical protein VJY43_04200 [Methanocorpusculum sp.]|nr:hypothetical protein [Methanocorpusculum sp.]